MEEATPKEAQDESADALKVVKELVEKDPEILREAIKESEDFEALAAFLLNFKNADLFRNDANVAPEIAVAIALLEKSTEEVKLFFTLLIDCALAGIDAQKHYDQSRLRSFIRALFAFIEGMTYVLKQFALAQTKRNEIYDAAELAMLSEETYTVSNRGTAETQPKFIPTDANFRFALQAAMKAVQPGFVLDTSGEGWMSFKDSIAVRNRITHPKHSDNMVISADEYRKVSTAFLWIMGQLIQCGQVLVVSKEEQLGRTGDFTQHEVFKNLREMFKVPGPTASTMQADNCR